MLAQCQEKNVGKVEKVATILNTESVCNGGKNPSLIAPGKSDADEWGKVLTERWWNVDELDMKNRLWGFRRRVVGCSKRAS